MKTVILEHEYASPAKEVWAVATDLDALKEIMDGVVSFEGLPSGRVYQGQKITVQVSLFGKLPPQPYFMEVLECDDEAMTLRSSEKGAGVKSWRHTLSVEPQQSGSRLRDVIEIDAGWMSWAFALWARFLYRKRHEPRVQILADMRAKRSETELSDSESP
ncbi:Ligand-binding SRPBCC domain-containing protein [Paracoccus isoporae]|uniref:Ligand-binding SRPBCC domain-containing protein n=1 Tax=Paracoccus isoporae TaxID=591205 RepID=A0A1G7G778_9RHOB|nr:SRPBCC family protein [Paracoccus isoporae]SDE83998.1 Ligand-binding SRPBCC domain-containing protein [Paracoccus isoporae]